MLLLIVYDVFGYGLVFQPSMCGYNTVQYGTTFVQRTIKFESSDLL